MMRTRDTLGQRTWFRLRDESGERCQLLRRCARGTLFQYRSRWCIGPRRRHRRTSTCLSPFDVGTATEQSNVLLLQLLLSSEALVIGQVLRVEQRCIVQIYLLLALLHLQSRIIKRSRFVTCSVLFAAEHRVERGVI